jgi:hypothetical protein
MIAAPPESSPVKTPPSKKTIIVGAVIALLSLSLLAESFIIWEQRRVSKAIEAENAEAFGRFLKKGAVADNQRGTDILFRNVRFCWSQAVCVNARQLTATAEPFAGKRKTNFDNLNSFLVRVHNATVLISPKTLQGMFNESVFNYPDSSLRDLTVTINQVAGANRVKLGGSLKYILWIPFEMDTVLKVDSQTNTLVIAVEDLKVFGILPAKWLLNFRPFNLEKLLTLPPNQHLIVHQNQMMVKPFGLFPPPRIDGKIASVTVLPQWIELQFAGTDPAFHQIPQPSASNYIYLQGGNTQFGKIGMLGTQVQVIDRDPRNIFQFSLLNYLSYLPQSEVQLTEAGGAVLQMPDHRQIPSMAASSAENDENSSASATEESANGKKRGFWEHLRFTFKDWFGI